MLRSLVGSEMCIRDSVQLAVSILAVDRILVAFDVDDAVTLDVYLQTCIPVSYTHLTLPTIYYV